MKKLSLLLVAIIFAFSVNAQRIGLKVGTNLAGLSIDDATSAYLDLANIDGKMRPGMQFGLVIEKDLIAILDLRIEALYTQKGSVQSATGLEINTVYNYFEIPILAKVKLGPVYVTAGPYFAYALSGDIATTVAGVTVNDAIDFAADGYKKFDYGLNAGIGAQFGIGPLAAFAEVRGGMGIADINETTLLSADDVKKNMGLALSVGILLGK
jgi:hypothetical protein